MDRRISEETALPVHLVDEPLECVVHGAGRCLENEMFLDRPRA
jgi:rod shape-determining protein MreB